MRLIINLDLLIYQLRLKFRLILSLYSDFLLQDFFNSSVDFLDEAVVGPLDVVGNLIVFMLGKN